MAMPHTSARGQRSPHRHRASHALSKRLFLALLTLGLLLTLSTTLQSTPAFAFAEGEEGSDSADTAVQEETSDTPADEDLPPPLPLPGRNLPGEGNGELLSMRESGQDQAYEPGGVIENYYWNGEQEEVHVGAVLQKTPYARNAMEEIIHEGRHPPLGGKKRPPSAFRAVGEGDATAQEEVAVGHDHQGQPADDVDGAGGAKSLKDQTPSDLLTQGGRKKRVPKKKLGPGEKTYPGPDRYLVVDFQLEKGIGEVRSQLEHAIYTSHLIRRTLVLPNHLYFRTCLNEVLCRKPRSGLDLKEHAPWDAQAQKHGYFQVPRYHVPIDEIYDMERLRSFGVDYILADEFVDRLRDQTPKRKEDAKVRKVQQAEKEKRETEEKAREEEEERVKKEKEEREQKEKEEREKKEKEEKEKAEQEKQQSAATKDEDDKKEEEQASSSESSAHEKRSETADGGDDIRAKRELAAETLAKKRRRSKRDEIPAEKVEPREAEPESSNANSNAAFPGPEMSSPSVSSSYKGTGLEWLREVAKYEYDAGNHAELFTKFEDLDLGSVNIQDFLYDGRLVLDTTKDFIPPGQPGFLEQVTVFGHHELPCRSMNRTGLWYVSGHMGVVGVAEAFGPESEYKDNEVLHFHGGITRFSNNLLNFLSTKSREAYEHAAMDWLQPSKEIRTAADHLVRNLLLLTGGRNYLAVHFRRGREFLTAPIPHPNQHLAVFKMGVGTQDPRTTLLRINKFLMRDKTVGKFHLQDIAEWTTVREHADDHVDDDGNPLGELDQNHYDRGEGCGHDTALMYGNDYYHQDPLHGDEHHRRISILSPEEQKRQENQTRRLEDLMALAPQGQTPMDHYTRERYYFMATDERDPATISQFKDQGALLLGDLMDEEFVRKYMKRIGFQDWLGYLDQLVAVKGRIFLGSPMSIFTGAITNQRIRHNRLGRRGNGWLYRTVALDYHP